MAPPHPTNSIDANIDWLRMKLEQFRLTKPSISIDYLSRRSQVSLIARSFTSPVDILPLINNQKVLLECLYTKDSKAYGTIRVDNIAFEKQVFVRTSQDEWETYRDIPAWHSIHHQTDNTDAFTFEISLDNSLIPERIQFAICFKALSEEYWDNNQNSNYVLDVYQRYSFYRFVFLELNRFVSLSYLVDDKNVYSFLRNTQPSLVFLVHLRYFFCFLPIDL